MNNEQQKKITFSKIRKLLFCAYKFSIFLGTHLSILATKKEEFDTSCVTKEKLYSQKFCIFFDAKQRI